MHKRRHKYDGLEQIVRHAGYRAKVLPGNMTDGIALGPDDPTDRHRSFLIGERERGRFLIVRHPDQLYRIPDPGRVAPLCLALLAQLRADPGPASVPPEIRQEFGLVPIPSDLWYREEWEERLSALARQGWHLLSPEKSQTAWDNLAERFFPGDSPEIREPAPSFTWDISLAYDSDGKPDGRIESDLCFKALDAFRCCTSPRESLYAFDGMSSTWLFDPHVDLVGSNLDSWAVRLLNPSDVSYFVSQDFRLGMLIGFPKQEACVFGSELLAAIDKDRPLAFTKLLRVDGRPTGEVGL